MNKDIKSLSNNDWNIVHNLGNKLNDQGLVFSNTVGNFFAKRTTEDITKITNYQLDELNYNIKKQLPGIDVKKINTRQNTLFKQAGHSFNQSAVELEEILENSLNKNNFIEITNLKNALLLASKQLAKFEQKQLEEVSKEQVNAELQIQQEKKSIWSEIGSEAKEAIDALYEFFIPEGIKDLMHQTEQNKALAVNSKSNKKYSNNNSLGDINLVNNQKANNIISALIEHESNDQQLGNLRPPITPNQNLINEKKNRIFAESIITRSR